MNAIDIISIVFGSLGVGSLITFFVTRHDNKKGLEKMTKENTDEIKTIKDELSIIRAMALGSLYDRAKFLGEEYVKRGYVTMSEYSDWVKYLYEPYHRAGGDGTIDKLAKELNKLPIEG